GLVIQVLPDDTRCASNRKIDRFETQIRDRTVTLRDDLAPRAIQQLASLAMRMLDYGPAHLLRRGTRISNDLLRLVPRSSNLLALVLQETIRVVAIALSSVDGVRQRLLALLDRLGDRLERVLRENQQQHDEDHQRPDHHSAVGREQAARWSLGSVLNGFLQKEEMHEWHYSVECPVTAR